MNSVMNKYFRIILFLLALSACSPTTEMYTERLSLSVSVAGTFNTKATVADVPELMENDLSGGLDVYITGNGSFLHYRVDYAEDGQVHFVTSRWKKDGIIPGQTYDVYVLANPGSFVAPAGDFAALQSLMTDSDPDIYRLYDSDAGTYDLAKTNEKCFFMDGHAIWTPTTSLEQTIDVTLRRAASKIQIDFSLGQSLLDNWSIFGIPQWRMLNYADVATALENGTASSSSYTSTPLPMDVTSSTATGGSITTYCYPRTWTDNAEATMIILNVPLTDSDGYVLHNNYYSIPVIDLSQPAPLSVGRNNYYRVEVRLESMGSSGEQGGDPPLWLDYLVLPWDYNSVTDRVTVIGQEIEYLMVDPSDLEIREKVLANNLGERTRILNFWASDAIVCSETEVYYYDKTSTRVDASALSPVTIAASGYKTGTIELRSTALENNTVKYIRFRVSLANRPEVYEDILIRHYPLDYIQNTEGLWSSLTGSDWVNWFTDQERHRPQKKVDSAIFMAKVFYNNAIYSIRENGGGGNTWWAGPGYRHSNLHNNRMYIVQITSSSDDYTVGRVTLDANYQSQDHLVSPAFMIASQLGATRVSDSGIEAAKHCGRYKEVTEDGREYTGWRLPTREEIGIIMGYQYSSDAIDEVLSGEHYWTLEGKCVSRDNHSNAGADANRGYIRCVRDLTISDIVLFNQTR